MSAAFDQPATLIDAKYALLGELGSGVAGTVYEAEHLVVGKRVAIKLMHAELARDAALRARFVAEARAAARISHLNVGDIYDLGFTSAGTPYMVMELLSGETLREMVQRRGALEPGYACELVIQMLSGLEAAHGHGIVHRDLKPANVIVTHRRPDRPVVKVVDFGMAQGLLDPSWVQEDGLVVGTPMYMAPEQALGRSVDERADVYAAGAILYELVTGSSPFSGKTAEQVLVMVAMGRFRPVREVRPELAPALARAIESALARSPERRPRSASELARRLLPFVRPARRESLIFASSASYAPIPPHDADPRPDSRQVANADFPSCDRLRPPGLGRAEAATISWLEAPRIPRPPSSPQVEQPELLPANADETPSAASPCVNHSVRWRALVFAIAAGLTLGLWAAWACGVL